MAGLVDFEVLLEEAALDAVDLDFAEFLDVADFFAESLLDDALDDDAFGFVAEVFACAVFDPADFRAEGLGALVAELDFDLEDFLVVAMIVSPLIKRIQNEQSRLCKGHTIEFAPLFVIYITVFVWISSALIATFVIECT